MLRKFTFLFFTVLSFSLVRAGFTPVPVTGFTKDVIANGTGPARSSTTSSVDDLRDTAGFAFVGADYLLAAGGTPPVYFLPQSRLINSANTAGLVFQLAPYTGNNSLKLAAQNASGLLRFTTPLNASEVYILGTSGGGSSTITYTVKFTDSTSQVFTGITVSDWYDAGGFAVQGIGRVNLTTGATDAGGGTTNPRLYENRLVIDPVNYQKQIAYVSAVKTNTTGFTQLMAVSANTVGLCGPPTTQPSNLVLTPTIYGVYGSFTAAVPPANKYMVLRSSGTTAADTPPTDGVVYNVGDALGNATIISLSSQTTFSDLGLTIGSAYTYTVLGFSDSTCFGISPAYNIVLPITATATIPPCVPTVAGTYTVGPTGTYPTLYAAMTALNNAGGASGNIIVELQPTYTSAAETFPIVVPNISTSPCAVGNPTLTIRPAAGATGLVISGKNATAILDFSNTQRATLDGRPGGVGTTSQLTIINDTTLGAAIRIYNDASRNTITYCDIQGRNNSATSTALSGVVYIGQAGAAARGNDFNTISFSRIHGTANGTPTLGIVAYGNVSRKEAYNDSCAIANCAVYDFFSATAASAGIKLDAGNNAWTINSNSLYQTAARTYTTGNTHRGIWLTTGSTLNDSTASGFQLTNNFIGGSAAGAAGTAYTMGGSVASSLWGMDLGVGSAANTSVQANTIANIALSSSSTLTTGVFTGINTASGNINIGTQVANTIGSAATAGSISVSSGSAGTSFGIRIAGGNTINVRKNTISGITVSGTSNTVATNFNGIGVTSGTAVYIDSNTVGSTTLAGSINATASTSSTAQSVNGISITGGSSTSLSGNTIANLVNNYAGTSTAASTRGINITASASFVSGNTIRNLSNAAPSTGTGNNAALAGISMSSTNAAGCSITGNNIYSLVATAATTANAVNLIGIYYSGTSSTTSNINKNLIHSLELNAANSNAVITGIDFASATAIVSNNYIRLGINADGSSLATAATIRGISANSSTGINNFFYNTVYVGGTGVGNTVRPTYAFIRTASSGTYDIRNNLFINSRSNAAATGGKHYAIYFTGAITGAVSTNNIYWANGTGGVFGYNGTADVTTYTTGWVPGDASSAYGDPGFINATGNAATFNLHINAATPSIAESAGTPVGFFVTDDYDGNPRSTTLPDAGADEFNGVNPNICSGTPVAGTVTSSISPVCIGTSFTLSVTGSTSAPGITFQWQSSPDNSTWTNITGATTATYTTALTTSTYYRIVVRCNNSSTSANSTGLQVAVFAPVYAIYNGTSYTESFESWTSTCSTNDLPSVNWRTTPSTGNNSWRRNDQGASAGWSSTVGAYTPVATAGTYSARFHSYDAPGGSQGTMDFFVNMSAAGTSTNLKFDYINTSGTDSLVVFLSTNGGTTFTRLDSMRTRTAWSTKTINLTTNAATTVIRFQATSDFGFSDIGLDNVQLANFTACSGTPEAGVVFGTPNPVCSGANFTLSDTSATQLGGITYQWEAAPACTGPWTSIAGATGLSYTTSQTATTYYRLRVTCTSGNAVAYTACYAVNLSAPNACYCTPSGTNCDAGDIITSVVLTTLSNTTSCSTNGYGSYITGLPVPALNIGTSYPARVTVGDGGTEYVGIWIDYNQNGTFDANEFTALGSGNGVTITGNLTIPANALLGITRMRVRVRYNTALTGADACIGYVYGETEDYLVNIVNAVNPVTLLNFYGQRKGSQNQLNWITTTETNNAGFYLERSADGVHFSALTFVKSNAVNGNSTSNQSYQFSDLKILSGNNYYRLKQVDKDGKFTYSSIVLLKGDKVSVLTLSVLYPNPAKDQLNMILSSPKAAQLTLVISDAAGKIVQQQVVNAITGDNQYQLNVRMLHAGSYVIKAICKDGCESVIGRFVKQQD